MKLGVLIILDDANVDAKFKQVSDEKMTDLKRNSDAKHSGGYSRRGKNN